MEAFFKLAIAASNTTVLEARRGSRCDAVLRALARVARGQGFQVVAAAATSQEAIDLEDRTGIPTRTANEWFLQYGRRHWQPHAHPEQIAEALFGPHPRFDETLARKLEQATRVVADALLGERNRLVLSPKTLLIISEAQRLPVRSLLDLLDLAEMSGARTLIVGDSSGFPALAHKGGFASLTQILPGARIPDGGHARSSKLRNVQDLFIASEHESALRHLAEDGRIFVSETRAEALARLISEWKEDGGARRPNGALIITNSNAERTAANRLAQRARWRSLRIAPLHFLRVGGFRIHQSDRVVFTHGLRVKDWIFTRRIRAGETGTVSAVDIVKRRIKVITDRGTTVSFDPKRFPNILELGYAFTASRAAALQPSSIHALAGGESLHTLRAKILGASSEVKIFANRTSLGEPLNALAQQATRRDDEPLAADLRSELSRNPERRLHELRPSQRYSR